MKTNLTRNFFNKLALCIPACFFLICSAAMAQEVFVSGFQIPEVQGYLRGYELDGSFVGSTPTPLVSSLETDGSRIFAGAGTDVLQFDRFGNPAGTFASVTGGGINATIPLLGTDSANNVYVAFNGFNQNPRTSFRLDSIGNVNESFSHPDLVFPTGIDATADGTTWISNGANVGIGDRLFSFDGNGNFLADYALPEVDNLSSIAIIDSSHELVVADSGLDALHFYDISSGSPEFVETISAGDVTIDVFIDQSTNRIFGIGTEGGFEIDRDGNILAGYPVPAPGEFQIATGIVAFTSIPEPGSLVVLLAGGAMAPGLRRRNRVRCS